VAVPVISPVESISKDPSVAGVNVGAPVGDPVGETVGDPVGATVGDAVGEVV
jgi:hypothetical protein